MSKLQLSLVMSCVTALAAAGLAQETTPTVLAKPEAVLKHVPSGSLGVLVVRDIKNATDQVDKFLADTGLQGLLAAQMPGGALKTLMEAAQLGEGFNPGGGFAAVMLDPQLYGVDLTSMLPMGGKPATAPADQKLPFALFIPGKDIKDVFGKYKQEPAGKYTKVTLRMGVVLATKMEGYVVISPLEKALDNVVAATKKITAELSKDQLGVLDESTIAFYLNMKVAGPIAGSMMKAAEGMMKQAPGMGAMAMGPAGMAAMPWSTMLPMYRQMLDQMEAVVVGLKFVATGALLEGLVNWKPDSEIGKQLADYKPVKDANLLDRLPNLPYVAAGGATGPRTKIDPKQLDAILAMDPFAKAPTETKDKFRKAVLALQEQVSGAQFVLGGAPAGSGVFGIAAVLETKDAEMTRAGLADLAAAMAEVIKSIDPANAELQKLNISYKKDAEKIGETSIDAIEIEHPQITAGPADEMGKILGEQKVRIRIASGEKNRVVATFGGAAAMLSETLKIANAGKGPIPELPEVQDAMKLMPKDPAAVVLYNVGNIFEIIKKAMVATGNEMPLPFTFTVKTPIAIGVSVSGSAQRLAIYVPSLLIKDVAGIFSMMMPGAMPPPGANAPVLPPPTND